MLSVTLECANAPQTAILTSSAVLSPSVSSLCAATQYLSLENAGLAALCHSIIATSFALPWEKQIEFKYLDLFVKCIGQ
jgi:hypothetical protein